MGRGKRTYLYADLIDVLRSRSFEVVDATSILAGAFDKPYGDEITIIRWISEVSSKATEAAYEFPRPGIREHEPSIVIDSVLDENEIVDRWFTIIVASGSRAASSHAKTSTPG